MHAPTAIIVQESFLEPILEHLADLRQLAHHFVIVLGDEKGNSAVQSQRSGIRILNWADLEAKGKTLPKSNVPPPGIEIIIIMSWTLLTVCFQNPTAFSMSPSLLTHVGYVLFILSSPGHR